MAENNNANSGGIGILGLMFIVLFAGKIFEVGAVADWSWWVITAPLWVVPAVLLGFGGFCMFAAFVIGFFEQLGRNRR